MPRHLLLNQGAKPLVVKVDKDGSVTVPNISEKIWYLRKHSHVADCRQAISHDEALINKLYTVDKTELEFFKPRQLSSNKLDFTKDVLLDPDNISSAEEKEKFKTLCEDFTDVIQYDPGTYNGAYGYVKNSLELTQVPPPNRKCYVPKYSKTQMDQLALKMDELMELKILVPPRKDRRNTTLH